MEGDLISRWSNLATWREMCPHLSIAEGEETFPGDESAVSLGTRSPSCPNAQALSKLLVDDGYTLIDDPICDEGLRMRMSRGISDLETNHHLPATFILLFDECWHIAARSHHLLIDGGVLNRHMVFNFDVLAWSIDPKQNQSGFSPHRDRQPETPSALHESFFNDGHSKYATHWVAIEAATPENSCLYVIPKPFDPGYLEGDDRADDASVDEEEDAVQYVDPLSRALDTKQSYQNIRALPRQACQSVLFTHRILHWYDECVCTPFLGFEHCSRTHIFVFRGSRGNPNALNNQPRLAVSFVYSEEGFEAPYLSNFCFVREKRGYKLPPFRLRLLLVCAQLIIYYQRFNLSTSFLRACYDYCKENATELNEHYRRKVFYEYVKAMKEKENRDSVEEAASGREDEISDEDIKSEDEEALLEEMLDQVGARLISSC